MIRSTYTYVELEISPEAFKEIKDKLEAAGYQHTFHGEVIDMTGIAVKAEEAPRSQSATLISGI